MALLFWFCIAGAAGIGLFSWVLISEKRSKSSAASAL
jgi:hypothetical protein